MTFKSHRTDIKTVKRVINQHLFLADMNHHTVVYMNMLCELIMSEAKHHYWCLNSPSPLNLFSPSLLSVLQETTVLKALQVLFL